MTTSNERDNERGTRGDRRGRGNQDEDIRFDTGDTGRMINEPTGSIPDLTRIVDEDAVRAVVEADNLHDEDSALRDEPRRAQLREQLDKHLGDSSRGDRASSSEQTSSPSTRGSSSSGSRKS